MFFRAQALWGLLVGGIIVGGLTNSGCDRFLRQSNPNENKNVVIVTAAEFACLQVWPTQVREYFEDNLDSENTKKIFSCLNESLDGFLKFAQGNTAGEFTDQELAHFFNRYLVRDNPITGTFMSQLMKVKVLLVGGRKEALTRAEFLEIKKLIQMLGEEAENLRGHWKVLFLSVEASKVTESSFETAKTKAMAALARLLENAKAPTSSYEWHDFSSLVDELEIFLKAKQTIAVIKKWFPVADSLRRLFLGNSPNLSTPVQRKEAVFWTLEAYSWFAKYYYWIRPLRWAELDSESSWKTVLGFVDSALDLIEKSPQLKNQSFLGTEGIDDLIEQLDKAKLVQFPLSAEGMKNAYRQVLAHILQGPRLGKMEAYSVRGLEAQDLPVIKLEFNIWKSTQLSIGAIFGADRDMSYSDFVIKAKHFDFAGFLGRLSVPAQQLPNLNQAWQEWLAVLSSPYPIIFKPDFKMSISKQGLSERVDGTGLSIANGLRSLVRFVLEGYGTGSQNPWNRGLSKENMIAWEQDFRELGRAVKFLDLREQNSAERTFREAQFFTFSSRLGGQDLSSQQLVEELALLLSGGWGSTRQTMAILGKEKDCFIGNRDPFGQLVAKFDCFRRVFSTNFRETFSNLPEVDQYLKNGSPGLEELLKDLTAIGQIPNKTPGTVEFAEIRTMSVVLNYIEALMLVFDKNKDQSLSEAELLLALPRFRSMVVQMSPLKDWFVEDAFLYLVYKGKLPDATGVGGNFRVGADFASFKLKRTVGLGLVQRPQLLRVVSLMKTEMNRAAAHGKSLNNE